MSEKHLTELAWKTLALKHKLKDPGLGKALGDLTKCAPTDPEDRLKAIAVIEKQAEALKKEHKANKDLADYLSEILKESDKNRAAAELLKKSADKKSTGQEDDD